MGSKLERQNQYQRRLKAKIKKFEKKSWNTEGLKRELAYSTGEAARPEFITGHAAGDVKAQEKFAIIRRKRQQSLQE